MINDINSYIALLADHNSEGIIAPSTYLPSPFWNVPDKSRWRE